MDEQIEDFLRDILLLQGRSPDLVLDEVRRHLAIYEKRFRDREPNKRMKEKAVQVCHSFIRARVLDEARLRKGTSAVDHLQIVLPVIDARDVGKTICGGRDPPRIGQVIAADSARRLGK
jgi:hypothetical protein